MKIEEQSEELWSKFLKGKISHEQLQTNLNELVGSNMKDCGLIGQIQKHIEGLVLTKIKPESRSMKVLGETWNDIFYEINWQVYLENNDVAPLNKAIEHNVTNYFDRLLEPLNGCEGVNEYIQWTLKLDHIISYLLYKTDEKTSHSSLKPILEYYDFLNRIVKIRQYNLPKPFNESPLDRYEKHELEEKRLNEMVQAELKAVRNRPPCPNCGANNLSGIMNIVGNGRTRWKCSKCGTSYRRE